MIPDVEVIKSAVEDYIKYKLLEKWWLNNNIPNSADKAAKMEANYRLSIKDARTDVKTPSFETMLRYRRRTRDSQDVFQFNKM